MKYNLSEIISLIKDRRTIYPENYSDREVQPELIKDILNSALWAPNHKNTQPWRFIIYKSEESRKLLANKFVDSYKLVTEIENINQNAIKNLSSRPLICNAIIQVNVEFSQKVNEIEEIEASSCAIQNMLLTATAYGLGSFWSTPNFIYSNNNEISNNLNLTENQKCLGFIYFGYFSQEWPKNHRKPLEYFSSWK